MESKRRQKKLIFIYFCVSAAHFLCVDYGLVFLDFTTLGHKQNYMTPKTRLFGQSLLFVFNVLARCSSASQHVSIDEVLGVAKCSLNHFSFKKH